MKAIIFGVNGQDGYYLKEILHKKDITVIGVSRKEGEWIEGSVSDKDFVSNLIHKHQPNYVFHLAANSTTRHDALFENHETIATGTLNILEAVYQYSKKSKVFLSGSAVQFENNGLPIDEDTSFAPLSPYAISRIQSTYAARYYRKLGVSAYVGYFFNHDSPLRTDRHINQKIASAVNRIANGSEEKIEIGNIKVKKEFNFAGDMMQAVWLLVNQNNLFEAAIGSGKPYSIEDWLNYCFSIINKDWNDYVVIKNDYVAEYEMLVSNPEKLFSIGYTPKVTIFELAKMMINKKDI
jgi:GDPmannose 4,6-dehydratase